MRDAYRRHGFTSFREAAQKTGVHYTQIARMLKGNVPGVKTVRKWADALGESQKDWLAIAFGGDVDDTDTPAVATLATEDPVTSDRQEPPQVSQPSQPPDIPQAVFSAIAEAPTREEKVEIAIDYLKRPELGIRFGGNNLHRHTTEAQIAIIRAWEAASGARLLPPEII